MGYHEFDNDGHDVDAHVMMLMGRIAKVIITGIAVCITGKHYGLKYGDGDAGYDDDDVITTNSCG